MIAYLDTSVLLRLILGQPDRLAIEPTPSVLARASQPLPTALGTLDAIHLATALIWRDRVDGELVMATHDRALATAARSCGFLILGA